MNNIVYKMDKMLLAGHHGEEAVRKTEEEKGLN